MSRGDDFIPIFTKDGNFPDWEPIRGGGVLTREMIERALIRAIEFDAYNERYERWWRDYLRGVYERALQR